MLERLFDAVECGCNTSCYGFSSEICRTRIGVVCEANDLLNRSIFRRLSGECVLHGEDEYVTGYTYLTEDEDEMKMVSYIRGYLEGHIRCLDLR